MNQKIHIALFAIIFVLLLSSQVSAGGEGESSINSQLNEHDRGAIEVINKLQDEDDQCDVTIIVGDRSFRAHENILSAASPYFKAMFTNEDMRGSIEQSNGHTIILHDLDEEAFEVIKNYIYTGRISITDSNAVELLATASYLQMTSIEADCCDYMKKELNAKNCLGVKYIADTYSCNELLNYAAAFVLDAFDEVVKYPEFLELTKVQLVDIVYDDELTASEDTIYEAVMRWIRYKDRSGVDRSVHLPDILQHVRFSQMDPNYLEGVSKDPMIRACERCLGYVKEAIDHSSSQCLRYERDDNDSSVETRFKPRKTNCLFAVGGFMNHESTSSVEKYDHRIDKWTEVSAMTSPRAFVGATALNNILYAVGGFGGSYLSSIERYDPDTDKWVNNVKPLEPGRITHNHVVAAEGVLYVIGGLDSSGSVFQLVMKYDPNINEWVECNPLRQKKHHYAVGALDCYIYVLGGMVNGHDLNSVERYDPTHNEWHDVSPMFTKRFDFASAAHNGYLYAVGGYREGWVLLNNAERYDPRGQEWGEIAPMAEKTAGLGLAVANGRLYAVGGSSSNDRNLKTVEVYDPATDTWSMCAPMLKERAWFGLAAIKF